MLGDPQYLARWERKRSEYLRAGIDSWEKGGGAEGTLIETRNDAKGGLDAASIARLINDVILG
jgi:hypothetical protein